MAAAVLESVAVPRSSGLQRSQPSVRAAIAPVSSLPGARGAGVLPECKGLRLARRAPRAAALAAPSPRAIRRGIVCEAQDIAIEVPDVTKATWQSYVLESDTPVLVEFWAPWCGPCRMILPTIGELSKEYAGKLKCYKVNTDECPDIATQFGIRSIPTIMIFKNGEKKDAIIGAVPKSSLTTFVEKFL